MFKEPINAKPLLTRTTYFHNSADDIDAFPSTLPAAMFAITGEKDELRKSSCSFHFCYILCFIHFYKSLLVALEWLKAHNYYRLWIIIGSSRSVHFSINLLKTSNWSRDYFISTFNKEKYGTGWILTENFHYTIALAWSLRTGHIRGNKGQNSTGTRCRGFLAWESRCRDFLVLESRCCGFLSSEKTPWNHDVVAYLSLFLNVVVFLVYPDRKKKQHKLACNNLGNQSRQWKSGEFSFRVIFRHTVHLVW